MADMPKFDIPADMRAFAEKSVEQARKAFDSFISSAQNTIQTAEGHAAQTRAGVRDVAELAMRNAEKNMASSFDFARKLVQARDPQEALALHADYVRSQMQALADQAKELTTVAGKARGASSPDQT
jgi:phasin